MIRSLQFWVLFSISVFGGMSNSATAPTIPVFVRESLDGRLEFAGLLISISSLTAMIAMPLGGSLADRFGYRRVAIMCAISSGAGLFVFAAASSDWVASLSRVAYGFGNAVILILAMTWLLALAPLHERGRVLSIYGLSVWISISLGPQLGAAITASFGPRTVFVIAACTEFLIGLLFLLLPRPKVRQPRPTGSPRRDGLTTLNEALRVVWVAGIAAAAAWCAQGLMLGFLLVHLTASGLAATGIFGAASIFGVFAISVIVARIVLANLPDRIGPHRTALASLTILCAGLVLLAVSGNFALAAISAVLLGIGFSPLYPSLVMIATSQLRPDIRGLGLGMFGGFTSLGLAGGALLGGLILAAAPSAYAFLLVAGLQILAIGLLALSHPTRH